MRISKIMMRELEGELVSGNPHSHIVSGKDDIMIVGDRVDTQICGIEMGVGCLILCLDAPVHSLVLQLAEEQVIPALAGKIQKEQ